MTTSVPTEITAALRAASAVVTAHRALMRAAEEKVPDRSGYHERLSKALVALGTAVDRVAKYANRPNDPNAWTDMLRGALKGLEVIERIRAGAPARKEVEDFIEGRVIDVKDVKR